MDYQIGIIYSDTEEKNEGKSRLIHVLQSIERALHHSLLCFLALNLFNQLILIRTSYEQYNDAIEYATRTKDLYNQ